MSSYLTIDGTVVSYSRHGIVQLTVSSWLEANPLTDIIPFWGPKQSAAAAAVLLQLLLVLLHHDTFQVQLESCHSHWVHLEVESELLRLRLVISATLPQAVEALPPVLLLPETFSLKFDCH
jgi:hypothetical protein